MEKQTIRIGIIGAGRNTRGKHIPLLKAIPGVEIVSVCNRSRASSERVAQEFDIPVVYENWWELVAADNIDAVVIGVWPYLHCQATLASLRANKHVLVEARLAMDANEARQMLAAARAYPHLITQVVPSPIGFAFDKTVKRLISEEYLGDILAVEIRDHSAGFLDRTSPMHWRQDVALSGMNIMTLGIWYEALMRWVGEANSVIALGKTFVKMRQDPETGVLAAVRIPEHLNVIADMACGAQASFSISRVTGLQPERSLALFGSEGTLKIDSDRVYGGRRNDQQLVEITIPEEERGGWRVEEEFINAIRGLEPVRLTPFAIGLRYMLFTEAVIQSLALGHKTTVSPT